MGLSCLPNYDKALQGRVFLDLMNEPDGAGITWDASTGKRKPLGDYYLSAMDAISKDAKGKTPLFLLQVRAGRAVLVSWVMHSSRGPDAGMSGGLPEQYTVTTLHLCSPPPPCSQGAGQEKLGSNWGDGELLMSC